MPDPTEHKRDPESVNTNESGTHAIRRHVARLEKGGGVFEGREGWTRGIAKRTHRWWLREEKEVQAELEYISGGILKRSGHGIRGN